MHWIFLSCVSFCPVHCILSKFILLVFSVCIVVIIWKNLACLLHMLNQAMVQIILATSCTKSGVNERSISARVWPRLIQKCTFGNRPDTSLEKETSRSHAVLNKHEGEWSYCYSAVPTAARMLGNKDSFMEEEQSLTVLQKPSCPPTGCLHTQLHYCKVREKHTCTHMYKYASSQLVLS